jgi:hypothetical protein
VEVGPLIKTRKFADKSFGLVFTGPMFCVQKC